MSNIRREQTRRKYGFDSQKEILRKEKLKQEARVDRSKDANRRQEIENNGLYRTLIKGALGFDVLDGLLGFLEVGGDLVSAVSGIAYVGLSMFVVKSVRLTIAVLCVMMADLALGLIPMVGTLLDIVFCGNYINRTLIKGFVEGDKSTRRKVNLIASVGFAVLLLAIAFGVFAIYVVGDKTADIIHAKR